MVSVYCDMRERERDRESSYLSLFEIFKILIRLGIKLQIEFLQNFYCVRVLKVNVLTTVQEDYQK